ncbi:MAG TPA: FtsQ-type POTRA domain-containing protein [Thermoanaerobaculia bacterium]|nr:FtsQ-type POTRA domain-containing protein [Thermoanaerobaculia bacterium]
MSVFDSTEPRFFRPSDSGKTRRNYRSIQVQRLLSVFRTLVVMLVVAAGLTMLYRRTQSDSRFAIRHVEIGGAQHTSRADLDSLIARYAGTNVFHLDIARLRHEVSSLPWVSRVEIEKKLPDTLRIVIVERTPVALASVNGNVVYVDDRGTAFAQLTPAAGDPDLPLISGATGNDLARCVALLRVLHSADADLYSRVSEVTPLPPSGFAIFDRQLRARIYANESDLPSKWRDFYSIAAAEHFAPGEVAYADLRFDGRVVVKPLRAMPAVTFAPRPMVPVQITN